MTEFKNAFKAAHDERCQKIMDINPIDLTDEDLSYMRDIWPAMYSTLISARFDALRYERAFTRIKIMSDRQILEEIFMRGFK